MKAYPPSLLRSETRAWGNRRNMLEQNCTHQSRNPDHDTRLITSSLGIIARSWYVLKNFNGNRTHVKRIGQMPISQSAELNRQIVMVLFFREYILWCSLLVMLRGHRSWIYHACFLCHAMSYYIFAVLYAIILPVLSLVTEADCRWYNEG